MKNFESLFAIALITSLTGSSGCGRLAGSAESEEIKLRPVQVSLLTANATTMERTTTQPATARAFHEARIFAKASGYLTELNVDIGTKVKAGQVLAVLDVPEMNKGREVQLAQIRRLEAEERRAASHVAVAAASVVSFAAKRDKAEAEVGASEANLSAAQVELNRVTELVKQKAVADRLLDEARKKHESAIAANTAAKAAVASSAAEVQLANAEGEASKASRDVAKVMIDVARRELEKLDELIKYAKLTAPFDGVVTHRNVDLGDLVHDSQTGGGKDRPPLFVIAQIDKVRIRVVVPERDSPFADVGDPVSITLQALPQVKLEGVISRSAGVLEEQTRTMLVEVDLPNVEGKIRPGMFGQATITLAPAGDALSLPANAVRFDEQGKSYVYVLGPDNQVAIADVETGMDNGEHIEITSGINGDERIIGPSLKRLKPGQKVVVN